ncbi:unnamed protein product [Chondrus crispus]|uniref:Uncharacterized protein n=1 Tax=Chondrus crispus TaxID=2769 RepID=R7QMX1_CHOCR|nr:unnamed protein product [Chondrus crispus]CDF39857.1 unnamed protein product [Chondrus crispus]|eukprot:XP_005710151.1 unnamed protein product [Chondrus crispus]
METPNNLRGGNGLESDNDLKAKPIRRSFSISDLKSFSQSPKKFDSDAFEANSAAVKSKVEVQALSYFALTSHALSEEISHVQQAMVELAATSDARGLLAPFYFVVSGLPPLWRRIKALAKGNVRGWEIKFACTHSMLLTSILALSLFLPISRIEESEIAWVYTSAALAAQLSAEPTLFIGTIRVLATITGAGIGFGFTSILDAMGRSDHSAIQYLAIPYMFIMTIVCLLLVPPAYRYAAFLVIATNAIIIFCPRSTPECTRVLEKQSESCFPDWKYALSRSTNVALGVVFAMFFHLIFWPRYANQVALRYLSAAFLSSSRLFGKLHRTYFSYGLPSGSGSPDLEPSTSYARGDLLLNEDVYQKDQSVLDEIISKVGCPLADAMLLVKSEADVWQAGPFRLDPLIPRVLSDFVALSVSLVEMASLLGRRPIYSSSYGRSVFEHFIHPMLGVYETIQISLNNLVGITDRTVAGNKEQETRENSFDLHHAITHLARIRGKLRRDAAKRSFEFQKFSAIQLTRRKPCRFSRHGNAADDSYVDLVFQDLGLAKQTRDASYPRARSHNETNRACKTDEQRLCVDDVVLYDAFTFITDTCLSAFVRIAVAVLIDSEANLKRMKERRQEEKSLFAKFKRSLASRGVRRGHQDAP